MGQPAKLFYVRSNRTLRLNRFSTFLGELGLFISFNGLDEYFLHVFVKIKFNSCCVRSLKPYHSELEIILIHLEISFNSKPISVCLSSRRWSPQTVKGF